MIENSKIRQRACILQEISKLKNLPVVSDRDVEYAIKELSKIEDKTFLCSTILKEINGSIVYFDGVLALLAINLARNVLEKCVFTLLEKPYVADEKKLFLINILNQAGIPVDANLIHQYVKNPDEIIDVETEKFLKLAEVNPEAQIDFLDFYFGVNEDDRRILLETIINDYTGDHLANILIPLIYSLKDVDALKTCIEGLLKSKSYLAYAPLDWLIETSDNPLIISLSKKIRNELKIAGLRKNITTLEYYKDLFKTSKPLDFYVSSIDGDSNFSLVMSRVYNNGAISTFFTVLSLENGPVSCFGLSNITRAEYENILLRFFRDSQKIPLELSFGKALVDKFCTFALNNKTYIPYELLCWRQLTYDIEPLAVDIEEYMKKDLKPFKVSSKELESVIESEFTEKWFFSYSSKHPELTGLIDKICTLKFEDYEKFDKIVSDFTRNPCDKELYSVLERRFLYQGYFFNCLKVKNLSSLFYSVYLNKDVLKNFFKFSIKKSVYEFFLNLQAIKNNTDMTNIFAKEKKIKFFDFDSKKMIELIEKRWIN